MAQYTGKERVVAAFRREHTDRVPLAIAAALNCVGELGYTREEYLLDDEIAMKATARALEMFPSDIVRVPGDPTLPMVAQARFSKKHGPDAKMKPPLRDKSTIEFFSYQDPRKSKSYTPYLELCRRCVRDFPDKAVHALMPGPWSNAVGLRGLEEFLFDTVEDPEFVHKLMKITTQLTKERGEALAETGILMLVAGDPSASCSVISPKIYREFIKPYHAEIVEYFKGVKRQDFYFGLHICGYTDPLMEDLVEVGPDFIEIDGPSSLKRMVEVSGGKVLIRGNLPVELFIGGTREDFDKAVKECIDTAAAGSGYILSHGCALPPDATLERLRFYADAALKYGKLPLSH